ncbi:MAG TPA: hypothetical protein VJZ71_01435 [Phycisphaerae bacterium]|nr:hypothetical protein [Phycisphaerae bacterium]
MVPRCVILGWAVAIALVGSVQAQLSPGDMNCDGVADGLDIAPFVDCLLTGNCPPCGSCCAGDGTCTGTTQAGCAGTWTLGGTCSPNPCGARCCFGNGTCAIQMEADCVAQGGCFGGTGTTCAPNPCINRNTNPLCNSFTDLGSLSGDTGAQSTGVSSPGTESWYRVQIREDSDTPVYISAWVDLQSGPNNNYDLYIYCISCGGSFAGSSTNGTGVLDRVEIAWADDWGHEDTGNILIEVRWQNGACGGYDLDVYGNQVASVTTCNP